MLIKKLNRILKTAIALGLSVTMLMAVSFPTYANDENINLNGLRLIVAGEELTDLPMPPVIYNNYTLVPAREVFERLGAIVDWKPETKEIYVGYNKQLLIMQADNLIANVDGISLPMNIPPKIINDKTMIPLRFVSESFGLPVNWDSDQRVASVVEAEALPSSLDLAILDQLTKESAAPTVNPETAAPPLPTQTPKATDSAAVPAKDKSSGPIPEISAPETQITTITMPDANSAPNFTVQASSAISKVEKMLLEDNRFILDFYNAEMSLPKSEYIVGNGTVQKIRAAQNQTEPVKITRVVFDLMNGAEFSVSISADRKAVTVSFERNVVKDVAFDTQQAGDSVTLTFGNTPYANVYPLANPDRLVIDVPNAEMGQVVDQAVSGRFVSAMRSSQFDLNTARVVLDLKDTAMYTATTSGNTMTIKVSEPTFKNIAYDSSSHTIQIRKNPSIPMYTDSWNAIDQYNDLSYTIILPGDYSALLGYGSYVFNDAYLKSVLIQNNVNGQTELVIKESRILAYNITEDSQYVYIKAVLPKEKYARIVVLDAGHGGTDQGTSGNGLLEKDVNFDIVNRTAALLEQDGSVKVYNTRNTDVKIPLEDRPPFANDIGDLFVSVHCNSGDKNTSANGTETYYYPHDNDATIGISTKETATILQDSLLNTLGSKDRTVMQSALYVVKYTKIPSALVEVGFISNPEEAAKLASEAYRQKAAEALYKGIIEIFKKYKPVRQL